MKAYRKMKKEPRETPEGVYATLFLKTTAQRMKFCIKDFISQCDQIHRKLRI